jgi:DNA-binding GntR family transcriptional regulator
LSTAPATTRIWRTISTVTTRTRCAFGFSGHDLDSYYTHALRIWFLGLTKVTHLHQAVLEHREILQAIRDGDAERAATVMSKHIEGFEAEMRLAL